MSNNLSFIPDEKFIDNEDETNFIGHEYALNYNAKIMPCTQSLIGFLDKDNELSRPKNHKETNIIDLQRGKCYSFNKNSDELEIFFNKLEECRRQGVTIMFEERQNPEGSGIMLDFDLKLKDPDKPGQVTIFHLSRLITQIIIVINSYFDLRNYLDQNKFIMVGITSSCKNNNFHLLIPGIFLSKAEKEFLLSKIIESCIIEKIFDNLEFNSPESPLDYNCIHVPVFFIGNTRYKDSTRLLIKDSYILTNVYRVYVENGEVITNSDESISDKDRRRNICHEFSINFESNSNNKIIKKMKVYCKPDYITDVSNLENRIGRSSEDLNELNSIDSSLSILRITDPEVPYIISLLDILASWRSQNYLEWLMIIQILGTMGNDYKPLAMHFNMKCSEKFWTTKKEKINTNDNCSANTYYPSKFSSIQIDKENFDNRWNECVNNKYYHSRNQAMTKLYFLAKEDNPDKLEVIRNNNITNFCYNLIYNITVEGLFEHAHVAEILYKMCRYKFVMDRPKGAKKYVWYEFMMEGDKIKPGELYKWRELDDSMNAGPSSLELYITKKIGILFKNILNSMKDKRFKVPEGASDEQKNTYEKHNATIYKNFKTTCRRINNDPFIRSVLNRSRPHFDTPGFSEEMDQNPMIFGVDNGVLKLNKNGNIDLIREYHSYKISMYTKTKYKKFNPDDQMVNYLLTKIRSMFPDDRPDSFNWFMHWLGSALDGNRKEQQLLMCWGMGHNGKSFIFDMVNKIFGECYCSPLPSELLTRMTSGAESATPVLMTIKGKHLIVFSEIGQKEVLNIQVLKRLLGAENILGRKLHRDSEQFGPICGYVLLCNILPDIATAEESTWKRITLLHLPIRFYPKTHKYYDKDNPDIREADPKLKTLKDDNEACEAFFSIITFYWQSLQINYEGNLGNVPCPHINKDTENYRNKQDTLNQFINLRLVITAKKTHRTYMNEIVEGYGDWYASRFRTNNKLYRKNMTDTIRNSKLSKYLIPSRQGEYIRGMRFLAPTETKRKKELFKFKVDFNESSKYDDDDDDYDESEEDDESEDDESEDDHRKKDDESSFKSEGSEAQQILNSKSERNDNPKSHESTEHKLSEELTEQLKNIKPENINETLINIYNNYKNIMRILQKYTSKEALEEKKLEIEQRKELRKKEMVKNTEDYKIYKKQKNEKLKRRGFERIKHINNGMMDSDPICAPQGSQILNSQNLRQQKKQKAEPQILIQNIKDDESSFKSGKPSARRHSSKKLFENSSYVTNVMDWIM